MKVEELLALDTKHEMVAFVRGYLSALEEVLSLNSIDEVSQYRIEQDARQAQTILHNLGGSPKIASG